MDFDSNAVDLESLDEGHRLGRRSFLIGAFATGAAASGTLNYAAMARARRFPLAKHGTFNLGVSSGFPRPRGIVLWTRLGGVSRSSKMRLLVSQDRHFRKVVHEKDVVASSKQDFTARSFVKGLDPSEEYFYRFTTKHNSSPVGRFRTAPPKNSARPLKIVFYSCQNYQAGFYNVQRAIAKEKDVDLVLMLGDYVYESDYYEARKVRDDPTGRNKDGVVEFPDEWREKYHLYKGDADLKAMHAAHPYAVIWDDHEVEDNQDGRQGPSSGAPAGMTNDDHPRRISYEERRINSYQAFFNYHPRIRFKGDRDRIYEHRRMGKLVDLILTDERQYRAPQPCNDGIVTPCPEAALARAMLGAPQKDWFKRTLSGSRATWKLWGNEVMLMGFQISPASDAILDEWDGYQAERAELMDHITANGIKNVVGLTGDLHNFFAGSVSRDGKGVATPAMTEFVSSSATSLGLPEETGLTPTFLDALKPQNPQWKYAEFASRGYGVLDVTANDIQVTFKKPATVTTANNAATTTLAKFRVAKDSTTVEKLS
jgi:alkaline phosphatase D